MRIRKVNQTVLPSDKASIVDGYSTSATNGYSCNYVNNLNTCSTTKHRVGTWTDGRPIWEVSSTTNITGHNVSIFNLSNLDFVVGFQSYLKRSGDYHNINSWGKDSQDYGVCYVYRTEIKYDNSYTGTLYATIRYVEKSS